MNSTARVLDQFLSFSFYFWLNLLLRSGQVRFGMNTSCCTACTMTRRPGRLGDEYQQKEEGEEKQCQPGTGCWCLPLDGYHYWCMYYCYVTLVRLSKCSALSHSKATHHPLPFIAILFLALALCPLGPCLPAACVFPFVFLLFASCTQKKALLYVFYSDLIKLLKL